MSLTRLDDASLIATHVQNCLDGFHGVDKEYNKSNPDIRNKVPPGTIRDALGRFRLWVGNIGAHRKGRASLDHKLREASHIRDRVIELLQNLESVLREALELVTGERVPWEDLSDSESDTSEDLGPLNDEAPTELAQLASNMTEINSCLMRLSLAIRNPAPHDQFQQSSQIDVTHFEAFDVEHVRGKFPSAAEYLVLRLGKAISRRRQYLRYRQEHRKKLEQGLPSQPPPQEVENKQEVIRTITAPSEKIESTVASSIPLAIKASTSTSNLDDIDYYEDTLSQTSYASSSNDSSRLRLPPLPEAGQDGDPFECPLCFRFTSVRQIPAWHKHVYRDLQPYVCTFDQCEIPDRTYESRHEWFQHEIHAHWKWWECIEGCNMKFRSLDEFQGHLAIEHSDLAASSRTSDLVRNCERQDSMDMSAGCPLCQINLPSLIQLRRHLGKHHEELSLFALPSHMKDDGNEDDDDGVDDGSRSSIAGSDAPTMMEVNSLYIKAKQLLQERPSIVEAMDDHILDPTLLDEATRILKPDDVNTWAQYKRWLENRSKVEDSPVDIQHVHVLQAIMFHMISVTQETDEFFKWLIELHRNMGNTDVEGMQFPIDGRLVTIYQIIKAMFSRGGMRDLEETQSWEDLGYHLGWNEILTSDAVQSLKGIHQHYVAPYGAADRESADGTSKDASRVNLAIHIKPDLDDTLCELLGVPRATSIRNLRGLILNAKPELETPERMRLSFQGRILWHSDTLESILPHENEASIHVEFTESSSLEIPLPGLVDLATEAPEIEIPAPGRLVITPDRWLYLPQSTSRCFHVKLYGAHDVSIIASHRIEFQASLQELKSGTWATLPNDRVFLEFHDGQDFRAVCQHLKNKMQRELLDQRSPSNESLMESPVLPASTNGESYNIRVITGTFVSKKVSAIIQVLNEKLVIEVTPQLVWSLEKTGPDNEPHGANKARLPPQNNRIEIRGMKNEDTGEIEDVLFKAVPGETVKIWAMIQKFLEGEQEEVVISISESTTSEELSMSQILQKEDALQLSRDELPVISPTSPTHTAEESYGIGVITGTPIMKLPSTIQIVDGTLTIDFRGQMTWTLEYVDYGGQLRRPHQAHLSHNDHIQILGMENKTKGTREDVLLIAQVHEETSKIWAMVQKFLRIEEDEENTSTLEETTTSEVPERMVNDTDLIQSPSSTGSRPNRQDFLEWKLGDIFSTVAGLPGLDTPILVIIRFQDSDLVLRTPKSHLSRFWWCPSSRIGCPSRSEIQPVVSVDAGVFQGLPQDLAQSYVIASSLRLTASNDSDAVTIFNGLNHYWNQNLAAHGEAPRENALEDVSDSMFEASHAQLSDTEASLQHYAVKVIGLPEGPWTWTAGTIVDVQLRRRMLWFGPPAESLHRVVMYYDRMTTVEMSDRVINILGDVTAYSHGLLQNHKSVINHGSCNISMEPRFDKDLVEMYQQIVDKKAAVDDAAQAEDSDNSVLNAIAEESADDELSLAPSSYQPSEEGNVLEEDVSDSGEDTDINLYARVYTAEGDMSQCDPSRCKYAQLNIFSEGIEFAPLRGHATRDFLRWRHLEHIERADHLDPRDPLSYLALMSGSLGRTMFLEVDLGNVYRILKVAYRYRPEARVSLRPTPHPVASEDDEQPNPFYDWSIEELQDFESNVAHFGTDWLAIAIHMGKKTDRMVKNRYFEMVVDQGRADLEQLARKANQRRVRGEHLGPPPVPLSATEEFHEKTKTTTSSQERDSDEELDTHAKARDGTAKVEVDEHRVDAPSITPPDQINYPQLVSFIGETSAGMSTLTKRPDQILSVVDESFPRSPAQSQSIVQGQIKGYIGTGSLAGFDPSRATRATLKVSADYINFTSYSDPKFPSSPMVDLLPWKSLNWMERGDVGLAVVFSGYTVFVSDEGEGFIDRIIGDIREHRPTVPCRNILNDEMAAQDVVDSEPDQPEFAGEAVEAKNPRRSQDKAVSTGIGVVEENDESENESEESYSELLAKHQAFDDYPPLSEAVEAAGDPTLPDGWFDKLYKELPAFPFDTEQPDDETVDNEFAAYMDDEYFWIPSASQRTAQAYSINRKWALLRAVREKTRRREGPIQTTAIPDAVSAGPQNVSHETVLPVSHAQEPGSPTLSDDSRDSPYEPLYTDVAEEQYALIKELLADDGILSEADPASTNPASIDPVSKESDEQRLDLAGPSSKLGGEKPSNDPILHSPRPFSPAESWAAYRFELHARKCAYCHNAYEVHRNHERLCEIGHGLAQAVAGYVFNGYDGITYSTSTGEDNKLVPVEIPNGYVEVISLLKAIERSLRHKRRRPFVSLGSSSLMALRVSSDQDGESKSASSDSGEYTRDMAERMKELNVDSESSDFGEQTSRKLSKKEKKERKSKRSLGQGIEGEESHRRSIIHCIIKEQNGAATSSRSSETINQPNNSERIQLRCVWAHLVFNIWLEMNLPCQGFLSALKAMLDSRDARIDFSTTLLEFTPLDMRTDHQTPLPKFVLPLAQGRVELEWNACVEWLRKNKREEAPHMSADLWYGAIQRSTQVVDDNPLEYKDFDAVPSERVESDVQTTKEVIAEHGSNTATVHVDDGIKERDDESDTSDFLPDPPPTSRRSGVKKNKTPYIEVETSYSEDDAVHLRNPERIRLEITWRDQVYKIWVDLHINFHAFRHAMMGGIQRHQIKFPDNSNASPRAIFLDISPHRNPVASSASYTLCYDFKRLVAQWDEFTAWARSHKAARSPHLYAQLVLRDLPGQDSEDEDTDVGPGEPPRRRVPAHYNSPQHITIQISWGFRVLQVIADCGNGWQTFVSELRPFLHDLASKLDLKTASLDFRTHNEGPCGTYPLSLAQQDLEVNWRPFLAWVRENKRAEKVHLFANLRGASASSPGRIPHDQPAEDEGTFAVPEAPLKPRDDKHLAETKPSSRGIMESAKVRMKLVWDKVQFFVWLDLNGSSEAAFESIRDRLFRRKVRLDRNLTTLRLSTSPDFAHGESWVVFLEQFYLEGGWERTVQWIRANRRQHAPHVYGQVELMNEPLERTNTETIPENSIVRKEFSPVPEDKQNQQEAHLDGEDYLVRNTGLGRINIQCSWISSSFDVSFNLRESPQAFVAALKNRLEDLPASFDLKYISLVFTSEKGNRDTKLVVPLNVTTLQLVWGEVVTWLRDNTTARRTHVSNVQYHITASILEETRMVQNVRTEQIPFRTSWSRSREGKLELVGVPLRGYDKLSSILSPGAEQVQDGSGFADAAAPSSGRSLENFPKPLTTVPTAVEAKEEIELDGIIEQNDRRTYHIRIYSVDETFATLGATLDTTVEEIVQIFKERNFLQENCCLVLNIDHVARRLEDDEKPLLIQALLLKRSGYKGFDQIMEAGREDISHICQFQFLRTSSLGWPTRPPNGNKRRASSPPGSPEQDGTQKLQGQAMTNVGRDQIKPWEDAIQQAAFANIARSYTSQEAVDTDKDRAVSSEQEEAALNKTDLDDGAPVSSRPYYFQQVHHFIQGEPARTPPERDEPTQDESEAEKRQVNAAIGEDVGKATDRGVITGNIATVSAAQVNYSILREEAEALVYATKESRTAEPSGSPSEAQLAPSTSHGEDDRAEIDTTDTCKHCEVYSIDTGNYGTSRAMHRWICCQCGGDNSFQRSARCTHGLCQHSIRH